MEQREQSPWKIVVAIVGAGVAALFVAAAVVGSLGELETPDVAAQVAIAEPGPPPEAVSYCNRYAAEAGRHAAQSLAGTGGATVGEIVSDSDGGSPGTIVGLSYENSKSEAARSAYRECMTRELQPS